MFGEFRNGLKAFIEANRDTNPGDWRSQALGLLILIVVVAAAYSAGHVDGRVSAEAELPQVKQITERIDQLRDRIDRGCPSYGTTDFRGLLGNDRAVPTQRETDFSGRLGSLPAGGEK